MIRTRLTALLAAGAIGACSGAASEEPSSPGRSPSADSASTMTDGTVRLLNEALGPSRQRIAVAVEDLKSAGLWHSLSDHLYVIQIQSRPGVREVPDDGHLADAALQGFADDQGAGGLCSIMFFPAAIRENYRRWDANPETPGWQRPPERVVWASILAHELGHCFRGQPGERVASRWELRAIEELLH